MSLDYFPFYHSYLKKCEKLKDQELGRLVRALLLYSATGERQELAGCESIAFDFIADDIDRAKKSYDEKCQKNRENGKKAAATDGWRTVPNGTDRGRTVPNAPQSKDEDKSKDKSNTLPANAGKSNACATVVAAFLDRVNPSASQASLEELSAFAEEMGQEVCLRAMDIALDSKKATWPYIRGILRKWQSLGVKCLADIERLDKKPETQKSVEKPGKGPVCSDYSTPEAQNRLRNDIAELEALMRGGDTR